MASSEAYTSGFTQESGDLRSAQGSPLYDSLKLSGHQIRLLTIKSTMSEISCEMEVTDLHDQLPFNALSYVWGDPGNTEDIFINGHKHPVTISLASALRCVPQHLSQSKHAAGQKLWVDAICINQADNDEKGHQVAKMGEIYSQSGLVLCWLGPLDDSIGAAIDVIETTAFERYTRCANVEDCNNHQKLRDCIAQLQDRLERFKEVKDMKQLSDADKTSGTPRLVGYIEVYELANALEHATTVTGRVLQGPYGSELEFCKNDLEEKLFKLMLAYQQNWKLLHHIFKGRRDQGLPVGNWLGQSHFKTNIWCHSSDARATNPKDYYYGFLGLTKLKIVPDYSSSKSIGSISREFLAEHLKVYRDQSLSSDLLGGPLGLLMFAGVGYGWKADPDMPSWGPNFPGEAQSNPSSRGAADAVAFPGSRDIERLFEKEPRERITGPDLEVTLYILDRITMIGPIVSDYGRPELLHSEGLPITWSLDFALRHESYTSGGHPLTALCHLLEPFAVSESKETGFPVKNGLEFLKFLGRFNRPFQNGKPRSRAMLARFCYVRDFLAQVPVSVSSPPLWPRLIVKDPDHDEDEDQYMKEYRYIELLGAKCKPYNHAIAETKKGYIGRFPPRIEEGDLVCLLNVLNQVAVLREAGKRYQFVGTCFIAGLTQVKPIKSLIHLYGLKAQRVTLR
ncbi:heterokaryon incompatibility protein [Fusarium coicis]|nr:heterokaryon incompatibility protein [Fusarium coicis]